MDRYVKKIITFFLLPGTVFLLAAVSGCANGFYVRNERPSDITAEELLLRREMATDPSGVYKNADTFFQRQVVSMETGSFMDTIRKVIIETRFKKPNMFKITTIQHNTPITEIIFNGTEAVRVDYRNNTSTPIVGDELDTLRTSFVFGNAGTDLRTVFKDIEISLVTIDDEEFYQLKCTSKLSDKIPVFEVFIDAQDFLTRRFRTISSDKDNFFKYSGTIEAYGNYDDILIPERCSMTMGRDIAQSQIVVFELDVKFDENTFKFPEVAE